MRLHNELLHSRPIDALLGLSKSDKSDYISQRNVIVSARSPSIETLTTYTEVAEQLGLAPLELYSVFLSIASYIIVNNIVLPDGKKQKKQRGLIIESLLSNAKVTLDKDCKAMILFEEGSGKSAQENPRSVDDLARHLQEDPAILGRVVGFLKHILEQRVGLLILQQCSSSSNGGGISISAESSLGKANQGTNVVDHSITSTDRRTIRFGLLREITRQAQYDRRREKLRDGIKSGNVHLVPRFEMHNWPTDNLMKHLRAKVSEATMTYIKTNDFLCDPQDLKYQVLFRLTSFPVSQVFNHGEQLEKYLYSIGAYDHWSNILLIDARVVSGFTLNQSMLLAVIDEQAKIIFDRLALSPLPIREILTPTGIFAEPGWVIAKRNGDVFAVQEEGSANSEMIPLELREIDPELAKQIHGDLHYIHTPRADLAFGLYVCGDNLPFSVLALDKIDRAYKQNVLLAQGYDPRRCFDLTRLYSKPGTPGNTSSSIFALTFRYLREQYPETQAVVSAFMPSYATGVSMTSGGFDNPIMIKTLRHTFAPIVTSDGITAYEHLTRRRHRTVKHEELITNQFPLLPTIELMTKLRQPRFEPLPGVDTNMIEVHY